MLESQAKTGSKARLWGAANRDLEGLVTSSDQPHTEQMLSDILPHFRNIPNMRMKTSRTYGYNPLR